MQLNLLDYIIFAGFIITVISVGMIKSRGEGGNSTEYFLAGRGLTWYLIGISLIAANISTEHFVGMSGQAADYQGIAPASYEWMAAITLIVVAFAFLPYFLRTGIFTMPEFLEHRYSPWARVFMAVFMVSVLIFLVAAVTYSGALTLATFFEGKISLMAGAWLIGIMAALYVVAGGLKACAWADLIQGLSLIAGGAIIVVLALDRLGDTPLALLSSFGDIPATLTDSSSGITKFRALNESKLHMVLPRTDPNIPWTALVLGLWIPNFYYWGLNQYITQRVLGSASLKEGQRGIVFAAGLKLLIPFIIIIPGMIAFNLFAADMRAAADKDNVPTLSRFEQVRMTSGGGYEIFEYDPMWEKSNPAKAREIADYNERVQASAAAAGSRVTTSKLVGYKYDTAFPLLMTKVIPSGIGLGGFLLAAMLGAVVSSLAAMLNAASTIFTMDVFNKATKGAAQGTLVLVGRICVVVFTLCAAVIAPMLGDPKISTSIFRFIQEIQGFISPGILAVFVFGLLNRRAPASSGLVGLLINPVLYLVIMQGWPEIAFLNRMAICFFCVLVVMMAMTLAMPRATPYQFATNTTINLESSQGAKKAGIGIVIATLVLYAIFW